MWVQLKSVQNIEQAGVMRRFHPGDWVEVGKQTAMLWISRDEASAPGMQTQAFISDVASRGAAEFGLVVPEGMIGAAPQGWQAEEGQPATRFERTAIWDGLTPVNEATLALGLSLVERWEIAAPLMDYQLLACNMGSEEERALTKGVIRDLRVLLYDTRLMFVRRTDETTRLLEMWNKEEGERSLAFLRCLYRVKPMMLALPATWVG